MVNVYGRSGLIKFTSPDMAKRALKRLNGEDVFGNRIIVSEKNNEIDISPKKRRPVNEDSKFTSSYASALSGTKVRFFEIRSKIKLQSLRPSPRDGIKLTITNIDTALGEENIRQMMFSKIGKVCELVSLEIK